LKNKREQALSNGTKKKETKFAYRQKNKEVKSGQRIVGRQQAGRSAGIRI